MKKFFRNSFLLFNLIAIAGLLVSYLAVKVSPASWSVPAFFGLAYPYFLLANILFILFWLFVKTPFALLSFLTIALGYNHLTRYFQFSGSETKDDGIQLYSYNVKNFYGEEDLQRKEVAAHILDFLQEKEPDILCLQEVNLYKQKSFPTRPKKDKESPFFRYVHVSKKGGQTSYSRYPIIHKDEAHFEGSSNMILISDLKIDDDTLRLFNCHLQSYYFSDADIKSLDSLSFNNQEESYQKVKYTGSKLKQAFIKRTVQAETLHQLISQSPHPVVICGDFNDTPVSYTYHTVTQGLMDAFVQSGTGIGNTYLGKLPSFRIDYILHSPEYNSFNFHIDKVAYSDHYPISCVLIKNDQ